MAIVQKQLLAFHEAIQLTNLEENATLREKRNLLLDKLRSGLKRKFEGTGQAVPTFEHRNQGSYAMNTGVKPTNGRDYDIDVALVFNINPSDHPDPTVLKQWVSEILDRHPHNATINRPCVTVQYTNGGEDAYHVDFPIYAAPAYPGDLPKLALGFPGSIPENKLWQPSDFLGFIDAIDRWSTDAEDRLQFRRVVRYLKRWKDTQFSARGEGAPRGIGLTCAAHRWLQVRRSIDPLSQVRSYDDLAVVRGLVATMLSQFISVPGGRSLSVPLPTAPFDNPFARMSPQQVEAFEVKLQALLDALDAAGREDSVVAACELLREQFGDDFPVPKSAVTAAPAVISTAQYA